jgi:ubiquitin-like modifier-activating enzyme ATG7
MSAEPSFAFPVIFIPTEFWREIAELKLTKYRLSTEPIKIYGSLDKRNSGVILHAPSAEREADVESKCPGLMYLLNTEEDFVAFDRMKAVKELKATGGVKFLLFCFGDLKKHVFTYNLCFPFHSPNVPYRIEVVAAQEKEKAAPRTAPKAAPEEKLVDFEYKQLLDINVIGEDEYLVNFLAASEAEKSVPFFVKHLLSQALRKQTNHGITLTIKGKEVQYTLKISLPSAATSLDWVVQPGFLKFSNGQVTMQQDLSRLLDPMTMARDALQLNIKLMKWRIVPELDETKFQAKKFLLLGSGTLGCNVARSLIPWGVSHITFVDCGSVSYSNPPRQSLFTFEDVGKPKAEAAAMRLKEIVPYFEIESRNLEILMPGHNESSETQLQEKFQELSRLIEEHDIIMLLTDNKESRFFPTLLAKHFKKHSVAVALGFDSFLVKVQANNFGACYFCNDASAPTDSTSHRPLDLQCTVTRPGVSFLASSVAVETLAAKFTDKQHRDDFTNDSESTILGACPDQIRGFMANFSLVPVITEPYSKCICCSDAVLADFQSRKFDFVKDVVNNPNFLENVTQLKQTMDAISVNHEDDF